MTEKNAKRKNHEVQRAYLEQWLSPVAPKALWYIDLSPLNSKKEAILQSEIANLRPNGKYSSKAKFAIENFLYVPEGPDGRDDSLEDEYAALESEMVNFCRAASNGESHSDKSTQIESAIAGCLSHCFRDAYGWSRLLQHQYGLTNTPLNAKDFPVHPHQWLVENARRALSIYKKKATAFTWTIHWNIPVSLLTSDRPGWDLATREDSEMTQVVMPLGPNVMLIGQEPSDTYKAGELLFVQGSEVQKETWDKWNTFAVERARRWIVATSKEQLQALLSDLTVEKYGARVATEKFVKFDSVSGKQLP